MSTYKHLLTLHGAAQVGIPCSSYIAEGWHHGFHSFLFEAYHLEGPRLPDSRTVTYRRKDDQENCATAENCKQLRQLHQHLDFPGSYWKFDRALNLWTLAR